MQVGVAELYDTFLPDPQTPWAQGVSIDSLTEAGNRLAHETRRIVPIDRNARDVPGSPNSRNAETPKRRKQPCNGWLRRFGVSEPCLLGPGVTFRTVIELSTIMLQDLSTQIHAVR